MSEIRYPRLVGPLGFGHLAGPGPLGNGTKRSIRLRRRGPHHLATACAHAAPSASSNARPGNARHGCPRGASASRPCRRHTPASWRARHARYRGVLRNKYFHLYLEEVCRRLNHHDQDLKPLLYRIYSGPDSLGTT